MSNVQYQDYLLFVTLYKPLKPINDTYSFSKFWNSFYNPLAVYSGLRVDDNDEMQFSLNIGGKVIPEYPINSPSEFYTITKSCGALQQ